MQLDERLPYQSKELTLIDFADGSGSCDPSDKGTNTLVTGTVPAGSYTGIAFVEGVPEQLNHADPALHKGPLQAPGVSWGWTLGFRFVMAEVIGTSAAPDAGAADAGGVSGAPIAPPPTDAGTTHGGAAGACSALSTSAAPAVREHRVATTQVLASAATGPTARRFGSATSIPRPAASSPTWAPFFRRPISPRACNVTARVPRARRCSRPWASTSTPVQRCPPSKSFASSEVAVAFACACLVVVFGRRADARLGVRRRGRPCARRLWPHARRRRCALSRQRLRRAGRRRGHAAVALDASTPPAPLDAGFLWNLPRGFSAQPAVPADNPITSEKVELGRHLFYDKRLSDNQTYSCATCHKQELAFTDGRATGLGSTGQSHTRSSMSLANVGYSPTLTWATR